MRNKYDYWFQPNLGILSRKEYVSNILKIISLSPVTRYLWPSVWSTNLGRIIWNLLINQVELVKMYFVFRRGREKHCLLLSSAEGTLTLWLSSGGGPRLVSITSVISIFVIDFLISPHFDWERDVISFLCAFLFCYYLIKWFLYVFISEISFRNFFCMLHFHSFLLKIGRTLQLCYSKVWKDRWFSCFSICWHNFH